MKSHIIHKLFSSQLFLFLYVAICVAVILASVIILIIRIRQKKRFLRMIIPIICALILICALPTFVFFTREYKKPLRVEIHDIDKTVVVEEWQWLLGSGADIYIKDGWRKMYLGDAGGGDDGYCPFEDGKYEISYQEEDNTITVRWFNSFDWEERVFELP